MAPINTADVKKQNVKSIFTLIRRHEPISRRGLEDHSGLSWGTVSSVTSELVQKGIVVEEREETCELGRPTKNLLVNLEKNHVLGIDINGSSIVFVVTGLAAKICDTQTVALTSPDSEGVLAITYAKIEEYLKKFPTILGIALAIQGFVDVQKGVVIANDRIRGFRNIPLKDLIEQKFGLPCFFFHDPDCLMQYERFYRRSIAATVKNCFLIRADADGIGMSVLIDRKLLRGSGGAYAEFGHTVVENGGTLCECGQRGCLETCFTLRSMAKRCNQISGLSWSDMDFVNAFHSGDPLAREEFARGLRLFDGALQNLISILDPQFVLLGGTIADHFREYLKEHYESFTQSALLFHTSKIVIISFEEMETVLGAVIGAADALSTNVI